MNTRQALEQSARDFQGVVWPTLREIIGGGELRSCETSGGDVGSDFDREAGIDWYQVVRERPLRGIASRVQWKIRPGHPKPAWFGPPWNTFSIREKTAFGNHWTELAKRLDALDGGGLMPSLVVQAYLEQFGGAIQSIGVVNARSLYEYVRDCHVAGREFDLRENTDGSRFIAVPFKEIGCWRWFGAQGWKPDPQLDLFAEMGVVGNGS